MITEAIKPVRKEQSVFRQKTPLGEDSNANSLVVRTSILHSCWDNACGSFSTY